jgi:predicted Fe-S protein YdhL (DUF1289 family)
MYYKSGSNVEALQARVIKDVLQSALVIDGKHAAVTLSIRLGNFQKANELMDDRFKLKNGTSELRKRLAIGAIGYNRGCERTSKAITEWQASEEAIKAAYGLTENDLEKYREILREGEERGARPI